MASAPRSIELSEGGRVEAHTLTRPDKTSVKRALLTGSKRWSRLPSLPGALLIAAFFGTWELAPRLGWVDAVFLPPISEVVHSGIALARDGSLWTHLADSLVRSLVGFGLAIIVAVPGGLILGWFRSVAKALEPLLEMFRCTPPLALLPVFILLLGIGESSKIALVFYSCSWPILLNTSTAVRNVDPLLIKSARTLGLSTRKLLWKVVLPAAVPTIFVGFRLAGALSLIALIAAEMLGAKAGLGYLIQYSQYNFQIPQMYAGILALAGVGMLFTQVLAALERRFSAWKPPAESGDGG